MNRRAWRWTMLLVVVLMLSSVSSCRNQNKNSNPTQKLSEKELWDKAVKEQTIKTFEQFLTDYPASDHVIEAKRALKDLWKDEAEKLSNTDMEKLTVVLETNRGLIKFKLFPKDAPNTCRNFIRLAKSHFYDDLTFHRVIDDYLIQGGCPIGNGKGTPGYTIPAEFNDRQHQEGTVAMARGAEKDSAGSQFYITLSAQPQLDGRFTVFGQVVPEGLEIIHAIGKTPTGNDEAGKPNDKPAQPQIMKKVYIEGLEEIGKK
jgi:peptidyl-prolyl cis-trans isomerase B (cyclophilin B)